MCQDQDTAGIVRTPLPAVSAAQVFNRMGVLLGMCQVLPIYHSTVPNMVSGNARMQVDD